MQSISVEGAQIIAPVKANPITFKKTWPKDIFNKLEEEYFFWKINKISKDQEWVDIVLKPMGPKCYGFIMCLIAQNKNEFDKIIEYSISILELSVKVE